MGDSGNGGTTLEFLSPFLWRAPPLKMRRESREFISDHAGEYDKVLPMDIYGEYLIKALIAGDIDRQEQLRIDKEIEAFETHIWGDPAKHDSPDRAPAPWYGM